MKQTLLLFVFSILALLAQARHGGPLAASAEWDIVLEGPDPSKLSIYPNPATDFIALSEYTGIHEMVVYNLVGKPMKNFQVTMQDQRFDVTDLPDGVYLVQMLDANKKPIKTQRLSKR